METTTTYLELLRMIKHDVQPATIYAEQRTFHYECGNYLDDNKTSLEELLLPCYSAYALATEKMIHYTDGLLTDSERRYIASVIKPYRNRISEIRKWRSFDGSDEQISIKVRNYSDRGFDFVNLPIFEKGQMYKGLEAFRGYTPEELEL